MSQLTQGQVDAFKRDGVLLLRGVFSDWIETLRAGVEANMRDPGPFGREYLEPGQAGRFFGDYCNWDRIPEYRDFMFDSPAPGIAADLMMSKSVRIFHEHVLVKEPGTDKVTPWHHDQPYYCVDGRQVCSMWIPLDPVSIETCPEFVAGSHDWGRWFLPRKFSGVDYDHDDDKLESIPDIDANRTEYDIRSWNLEPGDAIAFHFLTIHGAPSNLSATHRRRGFAARWLGDDTVYAIRSGEISPPFPGLEQRLKPGEPLDCEEFPQVFPKVVKS
ncbi:MAG: phytanoyl-CoA dioxygenase family protein [Gammaproteobacteria bacterium]|nr:phytanoyl-CoA dioxygenase family protein [Gammaproteobacteria bacterium]